MKMIMCSEGVRSCELISRKKQGEQEAPPASCFNKYDGISAQRLWCIKI